MVTAARLVDGRAPRELAVADDVSVGPALVSEIP